jgi:peptidoglycan DL-endopeptidase RipA
MWPRNPLRGWRERSVTAFLAMLVGGAAITGAASASAQPDPNGSALLAVGLWDLTEAPASPAPEVGEWDPTLPKVASANVPGDPVAVVNSVLQISQTSAQVTAEMGRAFLSGLGINLGDSSGGQYANGGIPRVYGAQAMQYVLRRALSQRGVPYSWGGGNAAGPSRGIDSGANTVGFDCSGLILYAFAGVGIKLPHYSGDQYPLGRHVPPAQARPGDVIYYGPSASQHEALFLGQGQMLEAPYTGSDVHISRVRTAGMMPYVVRFIDY